MRKKLWYKEAVIYEMYLDLFCDSNSDGIGDIQGLINRLIYIKKLGINCIWILPLYNSPMMDGGYDVSDFLSIRGNLGTISDFQRLIKKAHKMDIYIILDMVINHTSDKHYWFEASSDPNHKDFEKYKDYYIWSDDDKKYTDTKVLFRDYEKSNWEYSTKRGEYYFHRFYKFQPDLNWQNKEVFKEYEKILSFWIDLGVDGFRFDAVPYLYKEEGIDSENLPGTHKILKNIKSFIKSKTKKDLLFLVEANSQMDDLIKYFGDGFNEANMAFNFTVMPRIFLSIATGNKIYIENGIKRTLPIPYNNSWAIFLRNHDELNLDMLNPNDLPLFFGLFGKENVKFNNGLAERLASLFKDNKHKIILAYGILLSLNGVPIIYMGDELDTVSDLKDIPRNVIYDKRTIVRSKINWDIAEKYIWDRQSTYNHIRDMLLIRKKYEKEFSFSDISLVRSDSEGLLVYERFYGRHHFMYIFNISEYEKSFHIKTLGVNKFRTLLLSRVHVDYSMINMLTYSFVWIKVL
ncbi:alpha-amylase family glycosyl hydrolase [Patescibacteria group bacterium]|nr:alpha-amylase family glycosyl hydrolase [Patescibacteria group bacterium]